MEIAPGPHFQWEQNLITPQKHRPAADAQWPETKERRFRPPGGDRYRCPYLWFLRPRPNTKKGRSLDP